MRGGYSLLFVEDDQETIEYIHDMLIPYFSKIFVCYDGASGLESFRKHKPDMILTDINMPVMNGIEMIENIRRTDPDIHVVFFTSASDTSLLLEAINLSVDGFVVKPISDTANLLNPILKILNMLDEHQERRRLRNIIELQSREASLGEIVANISHQWRQPLNNIGLGIQDIFETLKRHNAEHLIDISFKELLMEQVSNMSVMLDDVRELFRYEDETISRVCLNDIFGKILTLYDSAFVFDDIRFILNSESDIFVDVNRMNIIHALINIINNSKYAMVNNNTQADRYLFITATSEGHNAIIKIRDSGGGINQEIIHKVFDPYSTSKHQNFGAGIGLYLTFQIIVYQNKGSIEAENVEYEYEGKKLKGAQVNIRLPLSR